MKKEVMVKCFATGKVGARKDFFKAPNKRYFQSEAVYEAWLAGRRKEKAKKNKPKSYAKPGRSPESYKKLCDTLADMIGYESGGAQPMPTVVFRKLKELDYYSDEIIQMTLDEKADVIRWAMENKEFSDDSGRASYMMAIVRNTIAEVDRREKTKKESTLQEERYNQNLDSLSSMEALENIGTVHKSHDVSGLFGGDDLWI